MTHKISKVLATTEDKNGTLVGMTSLDGMTSDRITLAGDPFVRPGDIVLHRTYGEDTYIFNLTTDYYRNPCTIKVPQFLFAGAFAMIPAIIFAIVGAMGFSAFFAVVVCLFLGGAYALFKRHKSRTAEMLEEGRAWISENRDQILASIEKRKNVAQA